MVDLACRRKLVKQATSPINDDFEEMIWRQGKLHCGVLRLENLPRSERMTLLYDVLDRHAKDLEAGAIVIALRTKFRIRRRS